jgi:hypothetical protein
MRVRRLIGILDVCSQIVYEDDKVMAFLDKFPLVTFRILQYLHAPSNNNKKSSLRPHTKKSSLRPHTRVS